MLTKFRIWDKQERHFLKNSTSLHNYSNWSIDAFSGRVIDYVGSIDGDHETLFSQSVDPDWYLNPDAKKGLEVIKESPYVIQRSTGIMDKNGKEIYQGDIVEMTYQVGFLSLEEQTKEIKFTGTIDFCEYGGNNLEIVVKENGRVERHSLKEAVNSTIIGNIFEGIRESKS